VEVEFIITLDQEVLEVLAVVEALVTLVVDFLLVGLLLKLQ
jgi:hypothetical protein